MYPAWFTSLHSYNPQKKWTWCLLWFFFFFLSRVTRDRVRIVLIRLLRFLFSICPFLLVFVLILVLIKTASQLHVQGGPFQVHVHGREPGDAFFRIHLFLCPAFCPGGPQSILSLPIHRSLFGGSCPIPSFPIPLLRSTKLFTPTLRDRVYWCFCQDQNILVCLE